MTARRLILAAVMVWLALTAHALAERSGPLEAGDYEDYGKYFAGTYTIIGKLPKSEQAYCGKVVLTAKDREFRAVRTVAGETTEGQGFVDVDPVGRHVFVMRFTQGGHLFEATYLFMNNFDHYPRFTGHVGAPGHSRDDAPDDGFEALFPADDPACGFGP